MTDKVTTNLGGVLEDLPAHGGHLFVEKAMGFLARSARGYAKGREYDMKAGRDTAHQTRRLEQESMYKGASQSVGANLNLAYSSVDVFCTYGCCTTS